MTRVSFGVRIPCVGPASSRDRLIEATEEADALGYDAVFMGDHISPGGHDAFARHKVTPPGAGSSREPSNTLDPNQFETIASLGYLGARTQTIGLGFGVTPLPLRDPILMAKQLATLDCLTGGRVIFGVGVANITDKEEFELLKVPFLSYAERYEQVGEYIAAMRRIWEDEHSSFSGRHLDFDGLIIYPKPAHRIPVWLGAGTLSGAPDHPPVRFALEHADGLMWPFLTPPDEVRTMIASFGETARAAGRDLTGFSWCCQRRLSIAETTEEARANVEWVAEEQADMWRYAGYMLQQGEAGSASNIKSAPVGTPPTIQAIVQEYVDAGSNWFDLMFSYRTHDALMKQLRLFAHEVMPAFR